MKYYFLQQNEAEPQRVTEREEDEPWVAWEAVSECMRKILEEWLGEAGRDGWIPPTVFYARDHERCNWDKPGGADGIELPYELVLPATGLLPEQTIRIWEWPNPDDCPGHESLAAEHMGESVPCDGTCVKPGTPPA